MKKLKIIEYGEACMRLIDADEFKNQIVAAIALFGASIDKVNAFLQNC